MGRVLRVGRMPRELGRGEALGRARGRGRTVEVRGRAVEEGAAFLRPMPLDRGDGVGREDALAGRDEVALGGCCRVGRGVTRPWVRPRSGATAGLERGDCETRGRVTRPLPSGAEGLAGRRSTLGLEFGRVGVADPIGRCVVADERRTTPLRGLAALDEGRRIGAALDAPRAIWGSLYSTDVRADGASRKRTMGDHPSLGPRAATAYRGRFRIRYG